MNLSYSLAVKYSSKAIYSVQGQGFYNFIAEQLCIGTNILYICGGALILHALENVHNPV